MEKLDWRLASLLKAAGAKNFFYERTGWDPAAIRRLTNRVAITGGGRTVPHPDVRNLLIPAVDLEDTLLDHEIPVRLYIPEGEGPFPVLIFFHGGGWVTGNLATHDNVCRKISLEGSILVCAVDYRLAPESPFPAALEDGWSALMWVADHIFEFKGDHTRMGVGGDSAGGTLSASLTQINRDRSGPELAFQVLLYPAVDMTRPGTDREWPSYQKYSEGYFLGQDEMIWFRKQFSEDPESWKNPLISPGLAEDLGGLPPALIQTARFDVLRDEAEDYADKLKAAGVTVKRHRYERVTHGFVSMPSLPQSALAIQEIGEFIKKVTS